MAEPKFGIGDVAFFCHSGLRRVDSPCWVRVVDVLNPPGECAYLVVPVSGGKPFVVEWERDLLAEEVQVHPERVWIAMESAGLKLLSDVNQACAHPFEVRAHCPVYVRLFSDVGVMVCVVCAEPSLLESLRVWCIRFTPSSRGDGFQDVLVPNITLLHDQPINLEEHAHSLTEEDALQFLDEHRRSEM